MIFLIEEELAVYRNPQVVDIGHVVKEAHKGGLNAIMRVLEMSRTNVDTVALGCKAIPTADMYVQAATTIAGHIALLEEVLGELKNLRSDQN